MGRKYRRLKKIREDEAAELAQQNAETLKEFDRFNNNPIEKICIVTVFDRHYKEAGKTLFNSIRRHTDCAGVDFKVITSDIEVLNELGKENCHFVTEDIKARYNNVKYSKDLPIEKYASSWYRYEIFNMTEYNRVICIDSDSICVEDISYLFSEELNQHDLISVEDHFVSKLLPPLYSQLQANGWDFTGLYKRVAAGQVDIQPAVLVVNKSIINNTWYQRLLAYANTTGFTYSIDQGILNDFIYQDNLKIKLLPLEWNYQDLYAIRCPQLPAVNPIIIHCQESKPFKHIRANVDERIQKFYDQWWDEHDFIGSWKTTTRMKGKICIATTFDYNYKHAGQTLFKSIRHHTDTTGIDFKVITNDRKVIAELGAENCHIITHEIKARYANVKYIADLPKEKYESSWYRYEMFNFEGYARTICIDSDCICLEDISYLFSEELNQYDIISTEDMIVSRMFTKNIPALENNYGLNLRGLDRRIKAGQVDIQPAVLVANKKIVNNTWYQRLLTYANETGFTYSIDEGILNDFIYLDKLNIKILPMEWNYMDTYGSQIPELPVPNKPIIVHCQESKPFKKNKSDVNQRIHKWYDRWWKEANYVDGNDKTIVAIIIWNRFENLKLWINSWKQCIKMGAELVVIHNLESDNNKYSQLCKDNGITYIPRENKGFDIGAFQDVCKERLANFPNSWSNLIWMTDDCIPMSKNFVGQFLESFPNIPCYEISNQVKTHIRTTGFLITKEISKKLIFSEDPIVTREHCYQFEHKGINMYEQIIGMGKKPVMIVDDLKLSPLWDSGVRGYLRLMKKHEQVFPPVKLDASVAYPPLEGPKPQEKILTEERDKMCSIPVQMDIIIGPRIPTIIPAFIFNDLISENSLFHIEIEKRLNDVMQSGVYLLGKQSEELESRFAKFIGKKYCIAVKNCTDALMMTVKYLLRERPDATVIVPNFGAYSTAIAVKNCTANIHFVDVDETLTIDVTKLPDASITKKNGIIIPVHLFGNHANMKALRRYAAANGHIVIEDCAHSAGSGSGQVGEFSCFSFYPTQPLGAMGDGGAICTNDKTAYEELLKMRNYGLASRTSASERPEPMPEALEGRGIEYPGINSRMGELECAVVNAKLGSFEQSFEKRRMIASRYKKIIAGIRINSNCIYHQFTVLFNEREKIISELTAREIPFMIHYPQHISEMPVFTPLSSGRGAGGEVGFRINDKILSLPCHPFMEEEHIQKVEEFLTEYKSYEY